MKKILILSLFVLYSVFLAGVILIRAAKDAPAQTPPGLVAEKTPDADLVPSQGMTVHREALPALSRAQAEIEAPATEGVGFDALPPSVRNFITHAAASRWEMKPADLSSYRFDAYAARVFAQKVNDLTKNLEEAQSIFDEEVDKLKQNALRTGAFQEYRDEESFRKALLSYEESASKPFLVSIEGEEEGPLGEPRPYFKIVAVTLNNHPALKEAKAFLDGFEEWRNVLRAEALALFSTAHRARTR